jgi:hypothetical protein
MEEPFGTVAAPPQPAPSPFVQAVAQALSAKQISPVCVECGQAQDWQDWMLIPTPVALPLIPGPGVEASASLAASLSCTRCGHVRLYRLDLIGVQVEQRRIIVPGG